MRYIAIGLTMLLVFGCIEVCAEEYTHKYHIENGIARTEKIKTRTLSPQLSLVNNEGIFRANYVECGNKGEVLLLFKGRDYIFDKEINEQLRTKLTKVLEYYKKEYDFYARLVVRNKGRKCYQSGNVIYIGLSRVRKDVMRMKWGEEKLIVFILLHEIKHAIDHKADRKGLSKEQREGVKNKIPHNKRPHEKRANEFAKREIEKWI